MSSRSTGTARTGLGAIDSERFDALAAVGGWRGILESVVPTLMFVLVMAVRPTALVAALVASLAISAIGLMTRLMQRQSPAQVVGGIVLVLVSALWARRSGDATNFYATRPHDQRGLAGRLPGLAAHRLADRGRLHDSVASRHRRVGP